MPLIQSEVVVVVDQDQPDSLTLRYTRTPVQSSKFDLYRFRISDESNTTKERMVDDIDTKVTFTGLTPGKLYNVTVWTVSDNVESRPLIRQDRLCEYFAWRWHLFYRSQAISRCAKVNSDSGGNTKLKSWTSHLRFFLRCNRIKVGNNYETEKQVYWLLLRNEITSISFQFE